MMLSADEKKVYVKKIEAMDGMLRILPYLKYRIKEVERVIDDLDNELSTGCVGSINLTDTYKDQAINTDARYASLIMQKTEFESKRRTLENYRALVDEMIVNLPEEQQELIKMRYEYRLSYDEIAEKTHRSRDSARRDLTAALERLSTMFAKTI